MVNIFALTAVSLAATYAEEYAIIALRLCTNFAVYEMIRLGKVVTVSASSLTNLGHFAVCALLFGLSNKLRTVIFTKVSM
jgi:EamA domain-containing membrane protein RarD